MAYSSHSKSHKISEGVRSFGENGYGKNESRVRWVVVLEREYHKGNGCARERCVNG